MSEHHSQSVRLGRIDIVHGRHATGPRRILDDDFSVEPLGDVRRDHAGVDVITSARAEADNHAYRLTLEEISFVGLSMRANRCPEKRRADRNRKKVGSRHPAPCDGTYRPNILSACKLYGQRVPATSSGQPATTCTRSAKPLGTRPAFAAMASPSIPATGRRGISHTFAV